MEQERAVAEAKKFRVHGGETDRMRRSAGALVLREDGWALLKPRRESGRVLTKQFVFEGSELRINADCNFGQIRVEMLDPLFRSYEGFSVKDSDVVHDENAERVWHTVRWRGKADVRSLWNKPVMIRFHLHEAELYGFQFVEAA